MNSDAQIAGGGWGQAKTWLTPDEIQLMRNACLTEGVPTFLQDHREAFSN